MFLRSTRFGALVLILLAQSATPVSASWFGDWFPRAGAEILPAPEADAATIPPSLVPPLQAPQGIETWGGGGEIVYPDATEMHLPPDGEYAPEVDVWGDDGYQIGGLPAEPDGAFDPYGALDPDGALDSEAAPECCSRPVIRYWNHPLLAIVLGNSDSDAQHTAILQIEGECCPIEVPVAIPACCVGAPECDARHGWLGRSAYEFEWPCGYRVKIVRWGNGPIVVHTYNAWGESCLSRRAWL